MFQPSHDDDECTRLVPSTVVPRESQPAAPLPAAGSRRSAVSMSTPVARPSRPLLDFAAHDDDDGATMVFDSQRASAPPPSRREVRRPQIAPTGRSTLLRHSDAAEHDIAARARFAAESGAHVAIPQAQRSQHSFDDDEDATRTFDVSGGHQALREIPPTPAPVAARDASFRPRASTSTASAFQRTEVEPAPQHHAHPPIVRAALSAPQLPVSSPGLPSQHGFPEAALSVSASRPAASTKRPLLPWLAVAATGLLLLGGGALVAQRRAAAARADAPLATAPVATATAAASPVPPPPAIEPPPVVPTYPGSYGAVPLEPAPLGQADEDTPMAVAEPAAKPAVASAPRPRPASAAPKPVSAKPAPAPKPVAASKPTPVAKPTPAEPKKKDRDSAERKSAEEANRLAAKQLEQSL